MRSASDDRDVEQDPDLAHHHHHRHQVRKISDECKNILPRQVVGGYSQQQQSKARSSERAAQPSHGSQGSQGRRSTSRDAAESGGRAGGRQWQHVAAYINVRQEEEKDITSQ